MPPAPSDARAAQAGAGQLVLERVAQLPGGTELMALAAERQDVELVGGATRDLMLGRRPRELDVVVDSGAQELAHELAGMLRAGAAGAARESAETQLRSHERFGTALVSWPQGRIDIATRRAESYAAPGALPDVRSGSATEDLRRRDFTVNAIAVSLAGQRAGTLRAPEHALEDLRERRLRVLHAHSFIDDPTRIMRLARYRARLSFEAEPVTAELVRGALAGGALWTVSGARLGAELRLALAEPDPLGALGALGALGVLDALRPGLSFDELLARKALQLLPAEGCASVLLLACLLLGIERPGAGDDDAPARLASVLERYEFGARERDGAMRAALRADDLSCRLAAAGSDWQLYTAARAEPLEGVALAAARAQQRGSAQGVEAARRWMTELRHVRLRIDGNDLLAAGIEPGPQIGRRLQAVLRRRLENRIGDSREAQLRAALEEQP